jgi:hypothetical protein
MKKIRVRFHLAAGKHYKHWQIRYPNGDIQYVNPSEQNMLLHGCQLKNRKGTAKRIHEGGEKVVCAWVECDWIQNVFMSDRGTPISYNPRVTPNWMYQNQNADNLRFEKIQTIGDKLISL